jgi:hypothetical protein
MDGWNRGCSQVAKCERMKKKDVGQEGMEKCLGSSQGPNWAVGPLVAIVVRAGKHNNIITIGLLFSLV